MLKRHRQYPTSLAEVETSPALCKLDLASEHAKSCLFYVDNFQCFYLPPKVCVDCILLQDISESVSDRELLDNTGVGAGAREALVVPPAFAACPHKLDDDHWSFTLLIGLSSDCSEFSQPTQLTPLYTEEHINNLLKCNT